MYVRMRIRKWDDAFEVDFGFISGQRLPTKFVNSISIGFLEVYDTLEDLLKEYPNETNYAQIEEIKK
jgi:hypothetical protein